MPISRRQLLLAGGMALPAALQARDTSTATGNPGTMSSTLCAQPLQTLLEQYRVRQDLPGLAAAIIWQGQVRYCNGLGMAQPRTAQPVQPDTTFHFYSVTKLITATAIMRLAEQGRLDLAKDVREYLPQVRFRHRFSSEPTVTLRHLLMHQSGFTREFGGPKVRLAGDPAPADMRQQLPEFLEESLRFEPGSDSRYSNINYALLGAVIEAASCEPFEQYMQREIFVPLGMTQTASVWRTAMLAKRAAGHVESFSLMDWMLKLFYSARLRDRLFPHSGWFADKEMAAFEMNAHGFGDLIGSVEDLLRFVKFHLALDEDAATPVLSRDARLRMRENAGRPFAMAWTVGRLGKQRAYSHSGGGPGYSSYVCIVPELKFGVAMLANRFTMTAPPLEAVLRASETSATC